MMNVHSCITSCNSCHFDVTAYSTQYICYILTCCFNKIRSVLSFDFLFIPLSFFSFRDMRVKIQNPIFILWKYVKGCIFISSLSKLKMNNLWSSYSSFSNDCIISAYALMNQSTRQKKKWDRSISGESGTTGLDNLLPQLNPIHFPGTKSFQRQASAVLQYIRCQMSPKSDPVDHFFGKHLNYYISLCWVCNSTHWRLNSMEA